MKKYDGFCYGCRLTHWQKCLAGEILRDKGNQESGQGKYFVYVFMWKWKFIIYIWFQSKSSLTSKAERCLSDH